MSIHLSVCNTNKKYLKKGLYTQNALFLLTSANMSFSVLALQGTITDWNKLVAGFTPPGLLWTDSLAKLTRGITEKIRVHRAFDI